MKEGSPFVSIFIGRSGCGKGTQAKLLIEYLKSKRGDGREVLYVETGHRFRDFIQGTSYSSRRAREIMEAVERQPDFLAAYMWSRVAIENVTGLEHIFLDGTPRSLTEAHILDTAVDFYRWEKPRVVHLKVSREWARTRLLERGRADDTAGTAIEKRFDWFERDTLPAVEFFRNNPRYLFLEIDGERPIAEIHQEIVEKAWPS